MTKIHKLSSNLSNQIAAGEVIERPASVVKELVENSLDAGSSRIRIDFIDAGLKEIQVQDNGSGITADQLDLAFTRHATSKISNEHDLFNVATLGFRGEALASIAAVSHVEVVTSTSGIAGVKAKFNDGQKVSQEKAAARKGTKITVRDLFYNTPARLKYLRSPRTEIMQIVDIVDRLCLAYPQVQFILQNKGKTLLRTTGNGNLQQDLANIYGRHVGEKMLAVTGQDTDFSVQGLISEPALTRSNQNYISLLLNGRYIRNSQLNRAIMAGYGNKLAARSYPIAVLAIQVDPLLVDVNVHPTKREVRLSKEKQLGRLLTQIIAERLVPSASDLDALTQKNTRGQTTLVDQLQFSLNKNVTNTQRPDPAPTRLAETNRDYVSLNQVRTDDKYVLTASWDENVKKQQQLPAFALQKADSVVLAPADAQLQYQLPLLTPLGQLPDTIIARHESDLFLVDKLAAIRWLKYETIISQLQQKSQQQLLLTPLVLDFGHLDFLKLKKSLPQLAAIGLQLEEFGSDSFALHSFPVWLEGDLELTVRKIIDLYLNKKPEDRNSLLVQIAQMVTQKAGRSRKEMSRLEMTDLLNRLAKTSDPYRDAEGKLIIVRLSAAELRQMFRKGR